MDNNDLQKRADSSEQQPAQIDENNNMLTPFLDVKTVKRLKEKYIAQARERLPMYFSADKRMKMQALSEEQLQQQGLPKEIFWKMVEFNVSAKGGISFDRLPAIGEHIDYLASEYITYKMRIENDFEGEEQAAQLAKLDEIFGRGLMRMSNAYIDSVGAFFERNEVAGEASLMEQSIKGIYQYKLAKYGKFAAANPNYAFIKGTEDAWLQRDSYFMGDILRLVIAKIDENRIKIKENPYTTLELTAVAAFYQAVQRRLANQKSTSVSEEQLGVELGFLRMKLELLIQKEGVSPELARKMEIAYNSFFNYKITDINQHQEETKNNPYTRNRDAYSDLNHETVEHWAKRMRCSLQEKETQQVFEEIISAAYTAFQQKVQQDSKLERYQEQNDWYSFYEESQSSSYQVERPDTFTYQSLVADWNDFIENIITDQTLSFH
ncbi:hypothetical protein JFL43_13815 [Viridibacillus sp. YIM B01967]|uniref:Uncharacterized protein n=1 Tax=Viridibacillus soli TaxID=2798301 RepID=A0ABS1H925_9BACL|nr:hypothetical protein [Viridibacillus soli]MBK3495917.1 hypothetical protein [Viridibacillus soli]